MVQEDAEPNRAIGAHSTSRDDAGKRDRLVLLLQGEQARPVSLGILAGQIADLEALDPHGHGVGVIGVVRLGRQTANTSSRTRPSGEQRPPTMRQRLSW
jgi:hypothetical protein